jgi:hypothetical protein
MNILLAQLVPALHAADAERWTDILAVVVFAAVWLIGGIIKATTKKPEAGQKKPSPRQSAPMRARPPATSRPNHPADFGRIRAEHRPPRPAAPQRRSRLERITAELEKVLGPYMPETAPQPASPAPKPQLEASMRQTPDVMNTRPAMTKEVSKPEPSQELLPGYADSDELTKAILYYEILGPPVSLRGPSHQSATS